MTTMMMRMSSRERDVEPKREGNDKDGKSCKAGSTLSRQWAGGLRNPRIVRVSRSFGGKDRHSKVCTIRGLRDRRIRLSVPTAIQLYDLQDRLGLTQPSKVIDWLLEATQLDIDKLPPLQIPPGFGHQFQQDSAPFFDPATAFTTYNNTKQTVDMEDQSAAERYSPGYRWDINDAPLHVKEKRKFLGTRSSSSQQEEEEEDDVNVSSGYTNLFPIGNNSSYYHMEAPPSLSLSQFGFLPLANTENNHLNGGAHHFLPSAQLFFCPPPSPFPHTVEGHDPRHIQLLTSAPHHRIKSSYFSTSQDESQPQPE